MIFLELSTINSPSLDFILFFLFLPETSPTKKKKKSENEINLFNLNSEETMLFISDYIQQPNGNTCHNIDTPFILFLQTSLNLSFSLQSIIHHGFASFFLFLFFLPFFSDNNWRTLFQCIPGNVVIFITFHLINMDNIRMSYKKKMTEKRRILFLQWRQPKCSWKINTFKVTGGGRNNKNKRLNQKKF